MNHVRHFLKDSDVSAEEQQQLLKVSRVLKRPGISYAHILAGSSIGLLFQKPSLRTRVSSETACSLLGASPVTLRGEELHFHRGETPEDSARVLSGYLDLMLARVYEHTLLERLAEPDCLPIVNGLSDKFHPLQTLADLLTLYEAFNGRLSGLRLTYLGDGNNVACSLLLAGALAGLHVTISCPQLLTPPQSIQDEARHLADLHGGSITISHDPHSAVRNADALYTDVWTSMGEEEHTETHRQLLSPYQINRELMSYAQPHSIVMHCLPAHFDEEITREVFSSKQSRVIPQAHNRLPTTAAVFLMCLWREKFDELARLI
jgi:ornithine carbamoyltransferase